MLYGVTQLHVYFVVKDIESARLILILGYRSGVKVHGKEEFYKERT